MMYIGSSTTERHIHSSGGWIDHHIPPQTLSYSESDQNLTFIQGDAPRKSGEGSKKKKKGKKEEGALPSRSRRLVAMRSN